MQKVHKLFVSNPPNKNQVGKSAMLSIKLSCISVYHSGTRQLKKSPKQKHIQNMIGVNILHFSLCGSGAAPWPHGIPVERLIFHVSRV